MESYETLPIVPLRDVVVFPHMMMPFVVGRPSSTRALDHALSHDKRIFLAAQKDAANDDPNPLSSFHSTVRARSTPSTRTFTFPSGSRRLWTMLATQPIV